ATGRRRAVVVSEGDGRFRVVKVETGRSDDRYTLVLDGLSAGDRVVTSGQFLIDSEASLRQQVQRLDEGEGAAQDGDHAPMDHDAMDHGSMEHQSMDHSSMDHASMDHASMDHGSMDHGSMNHESMDHGGMDHDGDSDRKR